LSLSPDVTVTAARDSSLHGRGTAKANRNLGAHQSLLVQARREGSVVVGFDLSAIDPGQLDVAYLALTVDDRRPASGWGHSGALVAAYALEERWTEGNGAYALSGSEPGEWDGDGIGVTWNCASDADISNATADCDTLWQGGSISDEAADSALHSDDMRGRVTWDVTTDVLAGKNAWLLRAPVSTTALDSEGGSDGLMKRLPGQVSYFSREGASAVGKTDYTPMLLLYFREQPDTDGDGVPDDIDAFPNDPGETADLDADGVGDNSDPDRDGDGVANSSDAFPDDSTETSDQDDDGVGDSSDTDVDGDGVVNESDAFPFDPARSSHPLLTIDTPASLITVGASPIVIMGQVDPEALSLTVNGEPVAITGLTYSAAVALQEGHNTISVRMITEQGGTSTASISVSLDMTPPYITVDSHSPGDIVYTDTVTVTGLVNDIVRGTIEDTQASVNVNGVAAEISNRSYAARGVALTEGINTLVVSAYDQVGNASSTRLDLTYQPPAQGRLVVQSGDAQSGTISTTLAEPLTVLVTDSSGLPLPDTEVFFRVIQGAGRVAANSTDEGRAVRVVSDSQGLAATHFTVGNRVGTGNHKVRAQVVGFDTKVVFAHSATARLGNKVSVNSGNNQRGGVHQVLSAPLTVAVTDIGSNVVAGARVQFGVAAGGGYFLQADGSKPQTVVLSCDSDGRASVSWVLGGVTGMDRQRVEVLLLNTDTGYTGTVPRAGFTASAFVPGDAGATAISGVVLDNQGSALPGTVITVEGTSRTAVADSQGQFTITEAPIGALRLLVDGSTSSAAGDYPTLSYNIVTIAGVDNPLATPIYLVKLDTDSAVSVGAQDAVLTMDQVPGFKLEVAAGSVTFPDGSREGLLSVTAVNSNRVPMAPPNGMQPQFIATIQPAGARFDPPARLTLPNVDGHLPGAQVEMYSFDHDLEEFVAIGLGTVSEDATVVRSNPGVGVIKAGWHCGSQPVDNGFCRGDSRDDPERKDCWNKDCNNPPSDDRFRGNPIEIATGNKFVAETDFRGTGPFPLILTRYYNSKPSRIAPDWSAGFHSSYSANLSNHSHDVRFTPYEYCAEYRPDNTCSLRGVDYIIDREYYLQVRQDNGDVLTYPVVTISRTGQNLIENPFPSWEEISVQDQVYQNSHGDFSTAERSSGDITQWTVRDKNGRVQEFDTLGRLIKLRTVSGDQQVISHQGNRRTITDSSGNTMVQTLNPQGSLASAVIGELVFEYEYDSSERLTKASYPGGSFKTYHYEDSRFPRALTGITDAAGVRYVTWGYDTSGRAVSSEYSGDAGKETLSFISNTAVLATNALGQKTTYRFEKINGARKLVEVEGHRAAGVMARFKSYRYYDSGLMKSRTDWEGMETSFEYNNRGLETRRTDAVGTPLQRTTETTWHPTLAQRLSVIEPGRTTRYRYNQLRRLEAIIVADRGNHFSYDTQGRLLSIDGPRTDVSDITTFSYSGSHLTGVTNALGQHSQLLDHNGYGKPRTLIDPNGVETLLVYNPRGWLSERTIKSQVGDATTTIAYTGSGLVRRVTRPDASYIEFTYDAARRLTSMSNNLGDSISYTLDAMGNRVEEVVSSGSGDIVAQRSRVFDDLGRLLEDVGAASHSTAFEYNPHDHIVSIRDARGESTRQAYDELQRLTSITDPVGGITQLDYDTRDNLVTVTDPRVLTTTYIYDTHNQVVSQNSPDTGATTFQHDAAGNVISRTDARGVVTRYSYDALNRLIARQYPADPGLNISYSYDANTLNPLPGEEYNAGIGRLTGVTDATGTVSFSYDERGNPGTQVQQFSIGPIQYHRTTRYTYNPADLLTQLSYPSGLEVSYTRDALGRIAGVSASYTTGQGQSGSVPIISDIDYLAFGAISSATYGNGLNLDRTFDDDGRLSKHSVGNVLDYGFHYDGNGNIVRIQDGVTPLLTGDFKYDALNRLSEERRNSVQQAFSYDAVGNRLQITHPLTGSAMQTNTYSESSNRLAGQDGVAISSDPAGNIIAWNDKGWTYDLHNRMSSHAESGVTKATYYYNGLGQRVKKVRPDQQRERHTVLHFNLAGQIIQETIFDSVNMPVEQRSYIWVDSMPVAYLKQELANGSEVLKHTLVYLHTDQLDTPRIGTNQDGNTVWRWDSDAFGVGQAEQIDDGSGVAAVINLRMPGQYFDGEKGSFYNYFRDYGAGVGRYMQSDPIGLRGKLNTYGYALQNPLTSIDPRGLEAATVLACSAFFAGYNAGGWLQVSPRDEFMESYDRLNQQLDDINNEMSQCDDFKRQAQLERIRKEHIDGMLDLIGSEYGDMGGMTASGLGSLGAQAAICAVLVLVPGL
jgi:RHS repeat-associated protein